MASNVMVLMVLTSLRWRSDVAGEVPPCPAHLAPLRRRFLLLRRLRGATSRAVCNLLLYCYLGSPEPTATRDRMRLLSQTHIDIYICQDTHGRVGGSTSMHMRQTATADRSNGP